MWRPKRVIFEAAALEYPRGEKMRTLFIQAGIDTEVMGKGNRVPGIAKSPASKAFAQAKDILVVRVRNSKKFETCKPSAHFQLPLASSCPGKCEYCYLHTTLGGKPYLRVYVNVEEILHRAGQYIEERLPATTVFEGAATSDPVPTEPYTGALADTIRYFAGQRHGRFRFVTKFTAVDSLLGIEHKGHTRIRYSVNAAPVIRRWEHGTPSLEQRLDAMTRVAEASYPMGVIIAPVILGAGWRQQYQALLKQLAHPLSKVYDLTVEIILHRFTARAKKNIQDIFPHTALPMDEGERSFKYGQFGYGKYVYDKHMYQAARDFFCEQIHTFLPHARLDYLV